MPAPCPVAVSVLQLVVWTGAAGRLPSAATGFAGLVAAAVSGFAERPVSAVASGWRCRRCRRNQCEEIS